LSGDLFTRSLYCIFRADGGVKTRSDRSFPLSHKGNMGKESPFSARTSIDKRAATQVSPQFAPVDKDEAKRPRKKAKGKRTSEAPAAGGRWSKEEDERLRQGVSSSGPKNWKHISELWMGGKRTDVQCLHRWNKVLKPGLVKGPWTAEEDEILRNCIRQGITTWSDIAEHVQGRIGKQCRERWQNHLHPLVKKGNWEPYEDEVIGEYRHKGHKWCDIARLLPGRTESGVKNRWNSLCRRTSKTGNGDENRVEPKQKRFKKAQPQPTTPQPTDPIDPEFAVLRNIPYNDKHEKTLTKLLAQLSPQFLQKCATQHRRATNSVGQDLPISPMASTTTLPQHKQLQAHNKQRMEVWEETCMALLGSGILPVKQEPVDGQEASRVFSGPPAFG
jgi:hypothetical protein